MPQIEVLGDLLKRALPPDAKASVQTFPFWRGLPGLVTNFGGTSYMDEHALFFYLTGKDNNQYSGLVKIYGRSSVFIQTYEALKTNLPKFAQWFKLLNPYRFAMPEVPGLAALKEYFEGAKKGGTKSEKWDPSDPVKIKDYGERLQDARKRMISAVSDPWGQFIMPHWHSGGGLYYRVANDFKSCIIIEVESDSPWVKVEHGPVHRWPDKGNDAIVDEIIRANSDIIRRPVAVRYQFGTTASDPIREAYKEFEAAFSEVNAKLETCSKWYLRGFEEQDYKMLVQQEIDGQRWLLNTFQLGDQNWLKPIRADLEISSVGKERIGMEMQSLQEGFFLAEGPEDIICVKMGGATEEIEHGFHKTFRNKHVWGHVHMTFHDFWLKGKDLTLLINLASVSERIKERDADGIWSKH